MIKFLGKSSEKLIFVFSFSFWTYIESTTDIEEQRINHKKTLEDTIKQYEKNIITINEIDKRCNESITSTKY